MTTALDTAVPEFNVDTGLRRGDREKLAELLNEALASTYVLYAKTHTYHWNVAGPLFYSVHKMTDEQYEDLAQAIDDLAERIRALGFPAKGGLRQFLDTSMLDDCTDSVPTAGTMVANLARDHQALAVQLRKAVAEAERVDDVYTADLLTSRIGVHEEASWMLEAMIAE